MRLLRIVRTLAALLLMTIGVRATGADRPRSIPLVEGPSVPSAESCETCGGDIWLVSTRGLPYCPRDGAAEPRYWRYNGCGGWIASNEAEFLASDDPSVPTCLFIHGNRNTNADAIASGWLVHHALVRKACGCPAVRFVIWSWPSERTCERQLEDVRTKARRADMQGFYLARFLDRIGPDVPIGVVAYSFGCRLAASGLHTLSGGEVNGRGLADVSQPDRLGLHVALVAPAFEDDWLYEGRRFELALVHVDRLLVIYNSRDRILSRYRLVDRDRGDIALGHLGFPWGNDGLATAAQIEEFDSNPWLGKGHQLEVYFGTPALYGPIRDNVLFQDVQPTAAIE